MPVPPSDDPSERPARELPPAAFPPVRVLAVALGLDPALVSGAAVNDRAAEVTGDDEAPPSGWRGWESPGVSLEDTGSWP